MSLEAIALSNKRSCLGTHRKRIRKLSLTREWGPNGREGGVVLLTLGRREKKTMHVQVVKCSFSCCCCHLAGDNQCCFSCRSSFSKRSPGGCLRFLTYSPHQFLHDSTRSPIPPISLRYAFVIGGEEKNMWCLPVIMHVTRTSGRNVMLANKKTWLSKFLIFLW